jgi:hypothetical protein
MKTQSPQKKIWNKPEIQNLDIDNTAGGFDVAAAENVARGTQS